MPIRPENRKRYPPDWKAVSKRIRFGRAKGRCECEGECGNDHGRDIAHHGQPSRWPLRRKRCVAVNKRLNPVTGSHVVLTVAHLDHVPENCADDNLRAMCQRCHLAYDRDHHAETRAANARKKLEDDGQQSLALEENQ